MSDQIKNSDIFAPDVFDTTKPEKYLETVELVELGLREILETSKKVMASNPFINSQNIKDYNKVLIESTVLEDKLLKVEKEKAKALQELEKLEQQRIKTTVDKQKAEERYNSAIEKQAKTTANQAKEQEKLNSVYEQTKQRYDALSKAQIELSLRGRENGKVFKAVKQEADLLRASLDKAEQGAGRFQRNVGNYKSGFNGLGASINQLTREMPAFANSVQTGFMAISNNLPVFFDEISRANKEIKLLREQGEQTPNLFSRLTSSLFSWGTGLSVGVTLLTVFGKQIVEFIGDLFKADEALKLSKESFTAYYDAITKKYEDYRTSLIERNVLEGKMSQEQANILNKDYELAKKMSANDKIIRDELITQASQWGVKLEEIYDRKTKTIIRLSEGEIMTNQLRRSKDVFDEIKLNKERNKILEDLAKKQYQLNKTDIETNEVEKQNIRTKAFQDLLKTNEKNAKKEAKESAKNQKEIDDSIIAQMEAKDKKKVEAEKILEKAQREHLEYEEKQADIERKLRDDSANEEDVAFKKSIANIKKEDAEKEEAFKKDKKRIQEELNTTLQFVDAIGKAKNDALEKQLDNDLAMRQRNIEQQQQLAIAGRDNTLAFEKAQQAKDELAKQQLAKREERRQKTLAFIRLVSAYADKGETDGAVAKAFVQIAGVDKIVGSYYEGTENVEEDLKGNKIHNGKDGYIIAVDGKERILNPKQNAMIGNLSNDELAKIASDYNDGLLPKYITGGDTGSFAQNTTNSLLLMKFTQLNSEIKDIKKALKERPVTQVNIDNLGNVIDTKITNGFKKVTTKKNSSPLNYI